MTYNSTNDRLLFSVATQSAIVAAWSIGDLSADQRKEIERAIKDRAEEVLNELESDLRKRVDQEVNGQPV